MGHIHKKIIAINLRGINMGDGHGGNLTPKYIKTVEQYYSIFLWRIGA